MICKVEGCNNNVVKEGYCRTHYVEHKYSIWLDNTDEDNPGIILWLRAMYPSHFRNKFSKAHKEFYLMLLRLYDPRYKNKQHRLREIIAFRGFAKSKTIFGIISYIMANNGKTIKFKAEDGKIIEAKIEENTMVILSETGGAAEEFVVNIRDEFSINKRLKYFYHFQIKDARDDETGQWTRRAFKLNNCFLIGLGAGMQIRGKVKGAYRPTFMFFDDIYSETSVVTYESRQKIKRWFYNAALNSVDDLLGKALLVGTIVHDDTVLVETENNTLWKTKKFFPMPLGKFKKLVEEHTKTNLDTDTCKLPYDDELDEFLQIQKQEEYFAKLENDYDWELTWKERLSTYDLLLKYKEAVENRNLNGFYQEYFHVTTPEELRIFRKEYFQYLHEVKVYSEAGYNWIEASKLKKPEVINIEFGLDIAGGKKTGDSTVITITGMLSNGKIVVIDQISGKFTMRDTISSNISRVDKIITDPTLLTKIGYIDETFRLSLKYKPSLIKVGLGGAHERAILEEMRRVFRSNYNYINIIGLPQTVKEGNKYERIKNTLISYYETMSIYHAKKFTNMEYQLLYLGKTKYDDEIDSLEVSVNRIQRPQKVEIDLFRTHSTNKTNYTEKFDWRI